jgi:protein Tex
MVAFDPIPTLSSELSLPFGGVSAVVKLLAEGATVPFIARYRKEATGGLDEVQIRAIEERRIYVLELEERRSTIRAEIEKQGKLDEALSKKIAACKTKAELEDLYLPFKPKRRTRAIIAKERGLDPLAEMMWAQGQESPNDAAAPFVKGEVTDVAMALAGARDICAERIAEDATVRKLLRDEFASSGVIRVGKTKEHSEATTKFDMYASFEEKIASIPSHRFLAIRRGEAEGVLRASLEVDPDSVIPKIARLSKVDPKSAWGGELQRAVEDAFRRLLMPSVESDVRIELKLSADRGAVDVFAQNLRQLLMSAPFGTRTVIGIDPGQRTGCKCAVVDRTGKLLEYVTFNLVQGDRATEQAKQILKALVTKHRPDAIAVGNGTHGRETEAFARAVVPEVMVVSVSEAGASVYSASEVARDEFPDLDLTVRGAVSIARRLQDPLAELVKIDPKSIGVGQYQHDVFQPLLGRKLDEVVESCVNQVGVELNTASAPLLSRVAGIGSTLAKRIVAHRNEKGPFKSRKALLEVAGVGPRTFEQCAGFLRIADAEHPLDASAVHPERYALVEKIANDLGMPLKALIANDNAVKAIDPRKYVGNDVGELTMNDILAELRKPGRDPRATFEPPKFRDDVRTMEDLVVGMELEGVVTNVTAFGAFVDIGVHQDGLVHVSKLADRFIKDPSEVVKVGDKLNVRVLEVDLVRKRISLTAKKGDTAAPTPRQPPVRHAARAPQVQEKFTNNPFARHFKK